MAHVTFLGANEALAALAAAQHHMVYTSYRKSTNVFLHTFHNGLVNRTSRSSSTKIYLPLCHTTSEWIYSNSIGRSTVFSGLKKGEKVQWISVLKKYFWTPFISLSLYSKQCFPKLHSFSGFCLTMSHCIVLKWNKVTKLLLHLFGVLAH